MKRDEAIYLLQQIEECCRKEHIDSEADAIALGIYAIGISKKDAISRKEAIKEVSNLVDTMSICISKDECMGMRSMKRRVIEVLTELPSCEEGGF